MLISLVGPTTIVLIPHRTVDANSLVGIDWALQTIIFHMSIRYSRNTSEQRSLNKLDILLADSLGPMLIPQDTGHYSARKRKSVDQSKKEPIRVHPTDSEEQQVIEEINKLNRIIRFKSQLLRNKFERDEPAPKKNKTPEPSGASKQVLLRYESNYNPKAFQELADSVKKEQADLEYVSSCFPEVVQGEHDAEQSHSRRKLNIEKEIKYRSNEVKQDFLRNNHIKHMKSEVSLPSRQAPKLRLELREGWLEQLRSVVMGQNGTNLFLYIMASNYPLFIGYVSYSIGADQLEKKDCCLTFERVYIIEAFRIKTQEELVVNLFRTLVRSLSEGQPKRPLKAYWSIKHSLLAKAERWGWKMAAFRRKHYVLSFAE